MKKFSGLSNFQAPQPEQAQPTTTTTQEEYVTPHTEEGHGHTNVNLPTANPPVREDEVPSRSSDDEREPNPDEL